MADKDSMELGEKVRQFRIENKMTQETLAELSGLSVNFISRLERLTTRDISMSNLYALSKALGVNTEQFLTIDKPKELTQLPERRLLLQKLDSLDRDTAEMLCQSFSKIIDSLH